MTVRDQDPFNQASLNDRITDVYTLYNDLQVQDVDQAALGWPHLPKAGPTGGVWGAEFTELGVYGGHDDTDPLGAERYESHVVQLGYGTPTMAYPDFYTTSAFRTTGTNAPYGAGALGEDGWCVVARANSSTDSAEIACAIPINTGLFSTGAWEFKVAGFVELAYVDETIRAALIALGYEPTLGGPMLGVWVEIDNYAGASRRVVIPRSIRMFPTVMNKDTLEVRTVIRSSTFNDLDPAGRIGANANIVAIGLCFVIRQDQAFGGTTMTEDSWWLGTWGLSVEPLLREDL
jgi:hypothetical protein